MCYVLEFQRNFNETDALSEMTVTIDKRQIANQLYPTNDMNLSFSIIVHLNF